jgi:hypothetical protein
VSLLFNFCLTGYELFRTAGGHADLEQYNRYLLPYISIEQPLAVRLSRNVSGSFYLSFGTLRHLGLPLFAAGLPFDESYKV